MMNRTQTALIGNSEAMQRIRKEADIAARIEVSVLIEGETGCGKELVASLIHQLSRREGKLVAVNVSAIPESIFEAEMFGHRRGAFTGAAFDRIGHVKEAQRGTLFLDEISSLALSSQVKLLRVLETGRVRPLGGNGEEAINFRVVAASNADLVAETQAGRFRADLFHRLCEWRIFLPPLRERPDDIAPLTQSFLEELRQSGTHATLSAGVIGLLAAQAWPGNIRQLRHTIRRAAFMAEGHVISQSTITLALAHGTPPMGVPAVAPPRVDIRIHEFVKLLESVQWDTATAAARLGVTRKTIYARLQKYGLEIPGKHQRRVFDIAYESGAA